MFSTKFAIDTVVWRKKDGDGKILAPWQSMISGFVAGVVGPVATGPFDVIKTRLMAQGRENLAAAAAGVPPSSSSSPPAVRSVSGAATNSLDLCIRLAICSLIIEMNGERGGTVASSC